MKTHCANITNMINLKRWASVSALLAVFLCGMGVFAEEFPTVQLKTTDTGSQTSLTQGDRWENGLPPGPETNYVVGAGLDIRTPSINKAEERKFKGNRLTLESGAKLVLKHQNQAWVVINDLQLMGGATIKEANGGDNGFLDGTHTINGTADNPVYVAGGGDTVSRWMKWRASLVGSTDAAINVISSAPTKKGNGFHVELHGDNAAYLGRFVCEGYTDNHMGIAAKHANALGAGSADFPVLTLRQGDGAYDTTFYGMDGYSFTNQNYTLAVNGSVYLPALTADADGVGLRFGGGATITSEEGSTGVLNIKKWNGLKNNSGTVIYPASDASVVFGDVNIESSVTGINIKEGARLILKDGYSNAATPITIEEGGSLTIYDSGVAIGTLTKSENDKIKIVCNIRDLTALEVGEKLTLLTAPNLNDFAVSDFVFEPAWAKEFIATLAIENNALTVTHPSDKTFVYKTGVDATDSFTTKLNWSDGEVPSTTGSGKAYLVEGSSARIRSGEKKDQTFGGDSLTIVNGGELVIIGGALTFKDLRMGSGGKAWPVRSHGDMNISAEIPPATGMNNTLDGFGTVYASKDDPFKILFSGGNDTTHKYVKSIRVWMKLSGPGDLAFIFDDGCKFSNCWAVVTNDNSQFTGGIRIERERLKNTQNKETVLGVDFANEAAFGGRASAFRSDRLKFVNDPIWHCSNSYDMTDETRGITIENGVTFRIEEGQTLNVNNKMTGDGLITKIGTGMLGLGGDNTLTASDRIWVQAGGLTLSHKNAISKRPVDLGLKNSIVKTTLRIESEEGVWVKAGADNAFNVKRAEALGNDITKVEAEALPDLEVAELENLSGSSKEVVLFRYENVESLEDHDEFKAMFNLVFPSIKSHKVEWGTKEIVEGKEYAITVTAKPMGFAIIIR